MTWHRESNGYALLRSKAGWTVVRVSDGHVSGAMPNDRGWWCAREDLEEMIPQWYSKSHAWETYRKLARPRRNW